MKKDEEQDESKHGSTSPGGTTPTSAEPSSKPNLMQQPLDGTPSTTVSEAYAAQQQSHNGTYVQFMKPKFARAPIKEAGRVAYLGESSNLSILVHDRYGTSDVVHYPLPDNVRGAKARANDLDNMEIDILHKRGAFLLPPRALCDELIEAFFKWVAPVVPVINKTRFMRQYRDPKNPPSLLLLQAMLLAGSRVCTNQQLMDSSGSTTPAAMTFYKRAKALYDANYEDDRVTIVQALTLMGWYWEGPEDVTKNVFYWSRVAVAVAQGSGMHRSVENSQLSRADKRLWKRIWWTLFSRDRSVAVALGRPCAINPEDADVEMICEEDFIEDEPDRPSEYPPDPVHVQFFIHYVKLCDIMGIVLSQQYSVASKFKRTAAMDLTHSDMALADWLQHCPKEIQYDKKNHHFWAALLHSNYYTTLCLLHRAHMPPAGSPKTNSLGYQEEMAYPSRNIAYQAAGMITSIIDNLSQHNELRYTPAFIVYSLFSALIMHVYQMRSTNRQIVEATEQRMQVCMNALREVSKVWLVAKMVHTLFESILGNKTLEERLQKAAGKRHKKTQHNGSYPGSRANGAVAPTDTTQKRKFDEMDIGFTNGPPSQQMSYERSRPQTPALTSSGGGGSGTAATATQENGMPQLTTNSPQLVRQPTDAFLGASASRTNTRPTTPFNPSFSVPGTPPELFLVTRDTPNLSQDLWQNFQPDQLFPADSNIAFPTFSPAANVDPQLSMAQQQPSLDAPSATMNPQHVVSLPQHQNDPSAWAQQMGGVGQAAGGQQAWNDETGSNSSKGGGPIVPTTLNVEDWFHFFGIHGDGNPLNAF
ncbi:hypothetical protein, variant [Verruconis gallopava]|nr:hypothetical protein, variant [Verruconis gallopava]KIW05896.1 hypothetical protein, variant [Verruconis gallopava]